jgi:hypothetical protein
MRVRLVENVHSRKSYDDVRNPTPKAESENRTKTSKKDLISHLFFVINSCNRRQVRNPESRG